MNRRLSPPRWIHLKYVEDDHPGFLRITVSRERLVGRYYTVPEPGRENDPAKRRNCRANATSISSMNTPGRQKVGVRLVGGLAAAVTTALSRRADAIGPGSKFRFGSLQLGGPRLGPRPSALRRGHVTRR